MPHQHTTQPGESLLELAYANGFPSWSAIWNDDANADLRAARKDPQVLAPGDVVCIPEGSRAPSQACPVNKSHRFRLTRPRAWVNLRMLDDEGESLGGLRYRLRVGDAVHEGSIEDDGMISVEIRPTEHEGHLTVWLEEPGATFEATVQVGHLDPASTVSGARARLRNLGVACAREDDHSLDTSPSTRCALESFQSATAQRDIHGRLDDATVEALESAHD